MDDKTLKLLGLSWNDYKVYTSILRGNNTISQLSIATSIHRRNIYDSINRLLNKGIISFSESNKKKLFIPSQPEKMLDIIKEKKDELAKGKKRIEALIGTIKPSIVYRENPFNVNVFIGKEGIKNLYNDILKLGEDYIGFGPGRQLEKIMRFYMKNFIKERIKRGIKTRQIYDESSRNYKYTKNPLLTVKYLPDESCSHAALRIYGDKTVIMLMDTKDPLAISIENWEIAGGYRKYFEVLWKSARK